MAQQGNPSANFNNSQYYIDNNAPNVSTAFYLQKKDIDGTRWSKYYPYQLMIVHARIDSGGSVAYEATPFVFTLPIPPQDLTVSMPLATTTQATLTGIVEQHGGAPFREISFNGTTGITPVKNSADPQDSDANGATAFLENTGAAIFAGTVSTFNQTLTAAKNVAGINNFTPNVNRDLSGPTDTHTGENNDLIPYKSTGYYQFRLLERFIESYSTLKSKIGDAGQLFNVLSGANTKDLRLALCIWKDEAVYLCSGVNFQLKRSANNPMEYTYTLQLKAWKRTEIEYNSGASVASTYQPIGRNPNAYSTLLSRMALANDVLQSSNQFFKSIIQDPEDVVSNISRQTTLFIKGIANVAVTVKDMPNTIKYQLIPFMVKNWNSIYDQIKALGNLPPSVFVDGPGKLLSLSNQQNSLLTDSNFQQPPISIADSTFINNVFEVVKPSDLPLSPPLLQLVNNEVQSVSTFTRLNFETMRDKIRSYSDNFANAVGVGDTTYNSTFSLSTTIANRTPTDDEWNVLNALNETASILDYLAASFTVETPKLTSMEYVAGLAQKSGIAFKIPQSKFAVPFPYGFTIERLAVQYLNDANRWQEIATLNGLQEPYVDEIGFVLPFLANGNGNTLYVSDASNLFPNQIVYLSAIDIAINTRHITSIKKIYDGYYAIGVDGADDLSNYSVSAGAQMQSYLPGTVNSQQVIYIPSDAPIETDYQTKSIPGLNVFDPLLEISGIDLLLTQSGDLAISADGDIKIAYGLQNIIQTVKLALTTPQGSLLQHPQFGIKIPLGSSTAEIEPNDLLKSIQVLFDSDPTFAGITSATVQKAGPVITISMVLKLAQVNQNVPVTLQFVG